MSTRFLCIGRVYTDLIFRSDRLPAWGHEVFAEEFTAVTGGGAYITAAYLAQHGAAVQLAGVSGSQFPFGAIVERDVAAAGIDASCLQIGVGPQVTVAVAGQEDRAFLTRQSKTPVQVPHAQGFDHLHVGELASLLECPDLIGFARANGASISADCGDQDVFPPETQELLNQLDVFLPNLSESNAMEAAGLSLSDIPLLVIKRGLEGARARQGDWISVPAQQAEVVDTTGAGDAFNAGFLLAWSGGQLLHQALEQGARFGARAVSRMGGKPC